MLHAFSGVMCGAATCPRPQAIIFCRGVLDSSVRISIIIAMTATLGRSRLLVWMSEDPGARTQAYIAAMLGCEQPAVSAWVRGMARPSGALRDGLSILIGGKSSEWELPEEQEFRAEMMARLGAA